MRLFIRAVKRSDTNVYTTLLNLSLRDPKGFASLEKVHVVSGDGDEAFLSLLALHDNIQVHFALPQTYEKVRSWKPKRRGGWSYMYALELAAAAGSDIIIMEDDVQACYGWLNHLQERIDIARSIMNGKPFALSVYYGFPKCPFASSQEKVVPSGETVFWGNLMTFYPKEVLKEMHERFRAVVLESEDMSTDLSVHSIIRHMGGDLLYSNPSLVQHQGDITTLRPDGIRRSPIYQERIDTTEK